MNVLQKVVRVIKFSLLILLGVVILFCLIMGIYHAIKLKSEEKLLSPTGQFVEVNGHKMHVITQGNESSKYTIVFISDWGIADGTVAYKPLSSLLTDKYRVTFVERSGYGYSEVSGESRDIDTVLDETREALKASGEQAPYVLMPHGRGGLEAIYWAQKYPDEVAGIAGLDIGTPKMYESIDEPDWLNWGMYGITRIGIHRFFGSYIFTTSKMGNYTWDELETMKALQIKSYYSKDMLNEIFLINKNAKTSTALPTPVDTPLLAFAANPYLEPYCTLDEKIVKYNKKNPDNNLARTYNNNYRTYFMQYKHYEIVELASNNLVYANQPEIIADKVTAFINGLD